jgi:tetratricopeptide (TPR) repeat protein
MENNVIETIKQVETHPYVPTPHTQNPTPIPLKKSSNAPKKWAIIGAFAAISCGVAYYLTPKTSLSDSSTPRGNIGESIVFNNQSIPVAAIQVKYKKAFKHLKRMDVYYREARDLLLDLDYENAVRQCDSALLCKTDKPLNWTAQKWGDVYNIQAESLLYLGKIQEAEAAAINALKMDKKDKLGYLHLIYAQILAAKDKKVTPLFLENFTFALKKRLPLSGYMELDGFEHVNNDPSVKRLLKQYPD